MHKFARKLIEKDHYDYFECKKCKTGCTRCDFDTMKCTHCEKGWDLRGDQCVFNNNKGRKTKECKNSHPNKEDECWDCEGDDHKWSFLLKKCVYCPAECSACNKSG